VAAYIVSDPTVARVTEYGNIEALKEGTTKITATAYGTTASVNFIVKPAASESDTTKDISISSSEDSKPGSSKGGCSTLPAGLILLSVTALFIKKH
ncbi:MAG: Ig-like domain-containing protein, partial [Synergistaceae bacterium]|nr:Ig-like domain-containing protein [Synergistaceae bacterium]